MIDFKKVSFNKAISLNPNRKIEIKSRWGLVKIKDISETILAGGDKPKHFSIQKTDFFNVPIYSNSLKNKGLYGYTDKAKIYKPSVTITARGTIGYCVARTEPFYPIVRLIVITPKKYILNNKYLEIILNYIDFHGNGAGISQLPIPLVENLQIPLPPLDIQEKIVKECEIVDNEVERVKKENEKLKEEIKNIIENIDGDKVKIENIVDIYTGKRPKGGAVDNGVFSIGGEHIQNGKIDLSNPKYIPNDFIKNIPKAKIEKDDILMCKDGAKSGKVAFVDNTIEAYVNEHIFILRTKNKITNKYIFEFLFSIKGQELLKNIVTGSAQGGINSTNLKNLQIPLPPLATQQQIVSQIEELEKIIDKNNQFINNSKQKKEEILKKYL
jgi:restriction endonuclease S subunit